MSSIISGYKCQECGKGTALEKTFPKYKTKVKGIPFTVENAQIAVCDRCGAEHFDPHETRRWISLFEAGQSQFYLSPVEIHELRKRLGLTTEQFAALLGCTRQSLHNWERSDRKVPQSRMADLMMRLIRESCRTGQVDVLDLLKTEAEKLGIHLMKAG